MREPDATIEAEQDWRAHQLGGSMLQEVNGAIVEAAVVTTGMVTTAAGDSGANGGYTLGNVTTDWPYAVNSPYYYYLNYPVYVYADKTKKAIEILKALQADKQIECKSVSKFIELVEKIAAML